MPLPTTTGVSLPNVPGMERITGAVNSATNPVTNPVATSNPVGNTNLNPIGGLRLPVASGISDPNNAFGQLRDIFKPITDQVGQAFKPITDQLQPMFNQVNNAVNPAVSPAVSPSVSPNVAPRPQQPFNPFGEGFKPMAQFRAGAQQIMNKFNKPWNVNFHPVQGNPFEVGGIGDNMSRGLYG